MDCGYCPGAVRLEYPETAITMAFRNFIESLEELVVGVYGYGRTGEAIVGRLKDCVRKLVVYEDDPVVLSTKSKTERDETKWVTAPSVLRHDLDVMVASPGVPGDHSMLRQAREGNIPVWDELELSYRLAEGGTFWAITGTNGKSTSADLAGELLAQKYGRESVCVCGNRGSPLIENVVGSSNETHYVVEVSSFQVEGLDRFNPDGGLLTSLGDDHRDYHDNLYEYHSLKWQLLKRVADKGPVVVPESLSDRGWLSERSNLRVFTPEGVPGLPSGYRPGVGLHLDGQFVPENHLDPSLTLFPENILGVIGLLEGVLSERHITDGLKQFDSLDYRAGSMKEINGRKVINDSKGTNPSTVRKLVERLDSPFRIVLGGEAKGASYSQLVETLSDRAPEAVVLAGSGSAAEKLETLCRRHELSYLRFDDWEEAVKSAFVQCNPGATVVLSPGGDSFDDFANFRKRGEAFDRWIEEAADEEPAS